MGERHWGGNILKILTTLYSTLPIFVKREQEKKVGAGDGQLPILAALCTKNINGKLMCFGCMSCQGIIHTNLKSSMCTNLDLEVMQEILNSIQICLQFPFFTLVISLCSNFQLPFQIAKFEVSFLLNLTHFPYLPFLAYLI